MGALADVEGLPHVVPAGRRSRGGEKEVDEEREGPAPPGQERGPEVGIGEAAAQLLDPGDRGLGIGAGTGDVARGALRLGERGQGLGLAVPVAHFAPPGEHLRELLAGVPRPARQEESPPLLLEDLSFGAAVAARLEQLEGVLGFAESRRGVARLQVGLHQPQPGRRLLPEVAQVAGELEGLAVLGECLLRPAHPPQDAPQVVPGRDLSQAIAGLPAQLERVFEVGQRALRLPHAFKGEADVVEHGRRESTVAQRAQDLADLPIETQGLLSLAQAELLEGDVAQNLGLPVAIAPLPPVEGEGLLVGGEREVRLVEGVVDAAEVVRDERLLAAISQTAGQRPDRGEAVERREKGAVAMLERAEVVAGLGFLQGFPGALPEAAGALQRLPGLLGVSGRLVQEAEPVQGFGLAAGLAEILPERQGRLEILRSCVQLPPSLFEGAEADPALGLPGASSRGAPDGEGFAVEGDRTLPGRRRRIEGLAARPAHEVESPLPGEVSGSLWRLRQGLRPDRIAPGPRRCLPRPDFEAIRAGLGEQHDDRTPQIVAGPDLDRFPTARPRDREHQADALLLDPHQEGAARFHRDPVGVDLPHRDGMLADLSRRQDFLLPGSLGRPGREEKSGQHQDAPSPPPQSPGTQHSERHDISIQASIQAGARQSRGAELPGISRSEGKERPTLCVSSRWLCPCLSGSGVYSLSRNLGPVFLRSLPCAPSPPRRSTTSLPLASACAGSCCALRSCG